MGNDANWQGADEVGAVCEFGGVVRTRRPACGGGARVYHAKRRGGRATDRRARREKKTRDRPGAITRWLPAGGWEQPPFFGRTVAGKVVGRRGVGVGAWRVGCGEAGLGLPPELFNPREANGKRAVVVFAEASAFEGVRGAGGRGEVGGNFFGAHRWW